MLLTKEVMDRLAVRKLRLMETIARHVDSPDQVLMLSSSMRRGDRESTMANLYGVGQMPGGGIPEFAVLVHLTVGESAVRLTPYLESRSSAIRRAADSGVRSGRAQAYAGEMGSLGSAAIAPRGSDSRR